MTNTVPASSRTLDVQQFIDERRFSPYQWFVLVLCFLIVATDGFDTAAIGFVAVISGWGAVDAASFPAVPGSSPASRPATRAARPAPRDRCIAAAGRSRP